MLKVALVIAFLTINVEAHADRFVLLPGDPASNIIIDRYSIIPIQQNVFAATILLDKPGQPAVKLRGRYSCEGNSPPQPQLTEQQMSLLTSAVCAFGQPAPRSTPKRVTSISELDARLRKY